MLEQSSAVLMIVKLHKVFYCSGATPLHHVLFTIREVKQKKTVYNKKYREAKQKVLKGQISLRSSCNVQQKLSIVA